MAREAVTADYFASLPVDQMTEAEDELRSALLNAINDTGGRARLSIAAQREEVRQAKMGLQMPQGAGLTQWITSRAADVFSLVPDPNSGEKMLCAAGFEHEVGSGGDSLEDFYASLPENEFTEEEEWLREQMLSALKRFNGKARLSQLTRGEQARDLQQARAAVLPKGAPFVGWLERRLGGEVSIETEQGGGAVAALLPAGRSAATTLAKQQGKGNRAEVPPARELLRPQQPRMPPALEDPKWRQRNRRQADDEPELVPEEQEAKREQAKLDRERRAQEFFDTLPAEQLSDEEQSLREALFASLEKVAGSQGRNNEEVRLSKVCQEEIVRQAKAALLPSEVTVANWIELRIGGEIVLGKDATGQVMCHLAPSDDRPAQAEAAAPRVAKEERDALMDAYFEGRPLAGLERSLKSLLLEAVASKMDGPLPMRLSDVLNSEPPVQNAWKSAKATWLAQTPPLEVSFARWVELRMAEEVRITREPYVQLSKPEQERRGISKNKRGFEGPYQSAYQQPPAKAARYGAPYSGGPRTWEAPGSDANFTPVGPVRPSGTGYGMGRPTGYGAGAPSAPIGCRGSAYSAYPSAYPRR